MKAKKLFFIAALMIFVLGASAQTQVVNYLSVDPLPILINGNNTMTGRLTVTVCFTNGDVIGSTVDITLTAGSGCSYLVSLPGVTTNNINTVQSTTYHLRVDSRSLSVGNTFADFVQHARCSFGEDDITFIVWH